MRENSIFGKLASWSYHGIPYTHVQLQLAIDGQRLDAVQYLLEAGANPNVGVDNQM